jgi:hypothetical protein
MFPNSSGPNDPQLSLDLSSAEARNERPDEFQQVVPARLLGRTKHSDLPTGISKYRSRAISAP